MKRTKCFYIIGLMLLLASCSKTPVPQDLPPQLEEMAELGTVEYTVKKTVLADDDKDLKKYFGTRKVIFSIETSLKAGIDMSEFSSQSIQLNKEEKSATVTLPHAKLLVMNIEPESVQMEWQKVSGLRTDFTAKERNQILKKGEEAIIQDVEKLGILRDAEMNAKMYFVTMLNSLGYSNVNVNFK